MCFFLFLSNDSGAQRCQHSIFPPIPRTLPFNRMKSTSCIFLLLILVQLMIPETAPCSLDSIVDTKIKEVLNGLGNWLGAGSGIEPLTMPPIPKPNLFIPSSNTQLLLSPFKLNLPALSSTPISFLDSWLKLQVSLMIIAWWCWWWRGR